MQEVTFTSGNLTLSGLTNNGTGPLILGLHGFLDNAASLSGLFPYFADYQFIALDLAGHGQSDHRSPDAHYHQMDYVQDLYNLIEAQGWQECILLGHSMGGILATLFAAVFPEKVKAVVSIDACGPLTKTPESSVEQLRKSIESRYAKLKKSALREVNLDKAVQARCNVADIPPEHAKTILARNLTKTEDGLTVWSSDPKLRTQSTLRLTEEQAEQIMRQITCPVWFGAASNSFKQVSDVYAKRQQWWRESVLDTFTGGHHIHMEKTQEVATSIVKFVEQM